MNKLKTALPSYPGCQGEGGKEEPGIHCLLAHTLNHNITSVHLRIFCNFMKSITYPNDYYMDIIYMYMHICRRHFVHTHQISAQYMYMIGVE